MSLAIKILIGLIAGVAWSVMASFLGWSDFTITWIDPFGQIFIRLLKMLAVPLVLFSIMTGVAGLKDVSRLGKLGLKTLGFYLCTTVIAVSIGLSLVNLIQPGNRLSEDQKTQLSQSIERFQSNNISSKIESKKKDAEKIKSASPLQFFVEMIPGNIFFSLTDNRLMLQVIFFAIFFGLSLALLGEKTRDINDMLQSLNLAVIKMIEIVMGAAPFFVFCLLAGIMAKMAGDEPEVLWSIFQGLSWFAATAVLGLLLMIFGVYPLIIKIFIRNVSIKKFYAAIFPVQMFAFSTSSSAATLPVTMDCVRDDLKVSADVGSFVLPIGATVNMDGTSLYQAVSAVFLAQFFGFDLSFGAQLTIVATATLASIGTPAVPSAGLVMLIIVLESVGMSAEWIALIFPIDRPLDMLRTVVNVTGDTTAASVIAASEGERIMAD